MAGCVFRFGFIAKLCFKNRLSNGKKNNEEKLKTNKSDQKQNWYIKAFPNIS